MENMRMKNATVVRRIRLTPKRITFCVVAAAMSLFGFANSSYTIHAHGCLSDQHWIGTWATAAQPSGPNVQSYKNQTLRLIVHTSIGGKKLRVKISNTYGDQPLVIDAHTLRAGLQAPISIPPLIGP